MIKTRKQIILTALLLTYLPSSILCQEGTITVEQQFDVTIPAPESASRQNRMRKSKKTKEKNKGYAKKPRGTTYIDFGYDQLVAAKNAQKARGNNTAVIKYIEQILKLCTDLTVVSGYVLELADTFFDDGQFKKAALVYGQYCALYPGSKQQEYALYRSIASSFAEILPFDRDQSKTEETLMLAELFLQNDHFTQYKDEVIAIQKECHQHLATSECNVCTFYVNKGCLKAAEKRLAKIREVWLPKVPTIEPEIIALEAQLTEKKEMREALIIKNIELAQNKQTKRMTNRF